MHPGVARVLATLSLLVGLVLAGLFLFVNAPAGTFGFTSTFAVGSPVATIDLIVPGGAAERAKIAVGDRIAARGPSAHQREVSLLFANPPLIAVGDRAPILVIGADGKTNERLLTADVDSSALQFEAVYFCALALPLMLLGWLIIWRKAQSSDAQTLGFLLLFVGLWNAIPDRVGPPVVRLILYGIFASAFLIVGLTYTALFFANYPDGAGIRISAIRRACRRIAIVGCAIELVLMVSSYASSAYLGSTPQLIVPSIVVSFVPPLAALVAFTDSFRHANPEERTRLKWLGGSFFLGFSGPLLLPAANVILGSRFTVLDQVLLESTLFILAIGLTYAILRRRVVDIAFALNRALVFSSLSAFIIAIFTGIEWLVGLLFVHISRPTSFLVEVGAAVIIGFSLRPLHAKIDHLIDRVFFAKRHVSERALQHLASEVQFIRERAVLGERVGRDLRLHLEASFVSIYFRQGREHDFHVLHSTGSVESFIDADDDAAVALAAREAPIHLHQFQTQISGELAIPLAVRKSLTGFLVLGEKKTGEAFAPDEIEQLRSLAGHIATALVIGENDRKSDSAEVLAAILDELRAQREQLRELGDALRATRERL